MEKKNQKLIGGILAVVAGVILLGFGIASISSDEDPDTNVNKTGEAASTSQSDSDSDSGDSEMSPVAFNYTHFAQLPDVTDGATIQGITTDGNASGTAKAGFGEDKFMMEASFSGLPAPVDGSFYEGWLVDPDSGDFFSTGVVEVGASGGYEDSYESETDYTDSHPRYVLTLEPNDGDPAPADHIVEATMTQQ